MKGGTDGAEVDSLSLDLEMDDDILLGPLSPTKIVMDKQMNIRKEDSPRGSNGNASSDGGTETDYSSSVSPNNVRQKNINQLQHFLKPKEKKKEQKKGTQKKKEATQGTRRSTRNSPVNHDNNKECKGDVELPNKTPTARRALQVRHNTLMLQPTPLTKTLVSFHSSKQSGQSQLVNQRTNKTSRNHQHKSKKPHINNSHSNRLRYCKRLRRRRKGERKERGTKITRLRK